MMLPFAPMTRVRWIGNGCLGRNKVKWRKADYREWKGRGSMNRLTLRSIVNVEALQDIQNRFADATGFAVVVADEQGVPVTNPSNFTQFCSYIREASEEGLRLCMLSDDRVGKMAASEGKPVIHRCHSGLVDLAAPIILNGQYLGAVLCGQVLIEEADREQLDQIRAYTRSLALDQEQLDQYFRQIEFTNEKRVQAAAEMLFVVANYVVKMGASHIAQQELHEKNQRLIEEHRHRAQLEKALKETQLRVLQSQINPHFLFNTLNTIARLAYLEKAENTQEVTYSLAKILRYSLRNVEQLVTLKEELEHVRNYLNIQQSRFRERIFYEEEIAFDSEQIKLPILCIHTLIENAIVHGFEPQAGKMNLLLRGYRERDRFILEVVDNGCGMSAERLSTIFAENDCPRSDHAGIGLKNVHKRLQHTFGEGCGITAIESKPGEGTMVRMTITGWEGEPSELLDRR